MKYFIADSQGDKQWLTADAVHRDADWILFTVSAPQMESRRINHPADEANPQGRVEDIMVSTGRVTQQPIAYFYKPTLVLALNEEPSDGDNA